MREWSVISPFIASESDVWLGPWVNSERHCLKSVPVEVAQSSWHTRKTRLTSLGEWQRFNKTVKRAIRESSEGLITLFPQMAVLAGVHKRLKRKRFPLVAWCFNLGELQGEPKRSAARFAMGAIDRIVVHSRRECLNYSQHFSVPQEKFEFVPLQRGSLQVDHGEDLESPFILSMGSARRDYKTFLEAVGELGIRTVIVASHASLAGLDIPSCVEIRSGLTHQECLVLAQKARINVIPIDNEHTASGQVTLVEAMMLARPVVATKTIGTEDYVDSDVNGILVPPRDVKTLCQVVEALWSDQSCRIKLGESARLKAQAEFSDDAAGRYLAKVLDDVVSCT